ncbi:MULTISPECIES: hypothetical protein [unclassified Rhizobium]
MTQLLRQTRKVSTPRIALRRNALSIKTVEAARITDASRHTIKDHLKALVNQGHLVLHGAGRGAWYGLS